MDKILILQTISFCLFLFFNSDLEANEISHLLAKTGAGLSKDKLEIRRQSNENIIQAVKSGDYIRLKTLLDAGANVNARDDQRRSILMHAIVQGHEIKEQVIQEALGARVEIKGLPAPEVTEDQLRMVNLLLARGADVEAADQQGKTPMVLAVERDYSTIVDALITWGADPDLPAR